MAASDTAKDSASSNGSFDVLDEGSCLHIFSFLSPRQASVASMVCKLFRDTAKQPGLWKGYYDQIPAWSQYGGPANTALEPIPLTSSLSSLYSAASADMCGIGPSSTTVLQEPAGPTTETTTGGTIITPSSNSSPTINISTFSSGALTHAPSSTCGGGMLVDWKQQVLMQKSVRELRAVTWESIQPQQSGNGPRVRPCAREGHAVASWGNDSLILFGGWGGGIRNDLYILDKTQAGHKWRVPAVAGGRPAIRYGHTITRCGPAWDMLLVFGGMQSGGYADEIEELAVLRPYTGEGVAASGAKFEYEWFEPKLKGIPPQARGYHAACAGPDGRHVYLFGGIQEHGSCDTLAVVNVETWEVDIPTTHGTGPLPRFGCSIAVWKGKLWVVGGGFGNDLARSGYDHEDVCCLDLTTWTWSRAELHNEPHDALVLGRCHGSCLMGSKLVMFGGSLELGNDVTWLDLETRRWGRPTVTGHPPGARMSAGLALSGTDILVFGGWIYSEGEKGDLYRIKCVLDETEMADMRSLAAEKRKEDTKQVPEADQKGILGMTMKIAGPGAKWLRGSIEAGKAFVERMSGRSGGGGGAGSSKDHQQSGSMSSKDGEDGGQACISANDDAVDCGTSPLHRMTVPTDEEDANHQGLLPGGHLSSESTDELDPSEQSCRHQARELLQQQLEKFYSMQRQYMHFTNNDQEVPSSLISKMRQTGILVQLLEAQLPPGEGTTIRFQALYSMGHDDFDDYEDDDDHEDGDDDDEDTSSSDEDGDDGNDDGHADGGEDTSEGRRSSDDDDDDHNDGMFVGDMNDGVAALRALEQLLHHGGKHSDSDGGSEDDDDNKDEDDGDDREEEEA